jgi:hypothetical protein
MRIIGTTSMPKNWRKNFWNVEYLFAFPGEIGAFYAAHKKRIIVYIRIYRLSVERAQISVFWSVLLWE